MGWARKKMFNFVKDAYNSKTTPTKLFNAWYFPTSLFLNRYLTNRLKLSENEKKLWKDYMQIMFSFPDSTEKALHSLF